MTFALILSSLALGVEVRCYETGWQERQAELGLANAGAYYQPGERAHIAFGPGACWHVRHATRWGAFILGHELAHLAQDRYGRPFDEAEANRVGWAAAGKWQRRLERLFVRPAVRLAP